jgi:hypothetical protein
MNTKEEKTSKPKDKAKIKKRAAIDSLESKNVRHQRHDYKYRKMDMQQEELWAEWREYYK